MWTALIGLAATALQSGAANAPPSGMAPSVISGPSSGDWNVNLGGSGVAFQGSTVPILAIAAIALGAIWFLRK